MPTPDVRGAPHPARVVAKALLIVAIVNLAYAYLSSRMGGGLGLGPLLPAQSRFPIYVRGHSEQTASGFGIQSVFDVPTLFWSHRISRTTKPDSEYRVLLLGDSTVRDSLLAEDMQAGQLTKCGRTVRIYSLGYYGPSIMKDLILLREAMKYKPDLVVWFFEQEALLGEPKSFARSNSDRLATLVRTYDLPGRVAHADTTGWWYTESLAGQRTRLNLQVRLVIDYWLLRQGLGQNDAEVTRLAINQVSAAAGKTNDPLWRRIANSYGELRPALPAQPASPDYLFSAITAGQAVAAPSAVIMINEPVNLGKGAGQYEPVQYGAYAELVARIAAAQGWNLLNLWDLVPVSDFIDRIHHGEPGNRLVEQRLAPAILAAPCAGGSAQP